MRIRMPMEIDEYANVAADRASAKATAPAMAPIDLDLVGSASTT